MATEIKKYLDMTALGTLVEQIKAEDAKGLQAAKDYADGLASNYDAAGEAASALEEAKGYTDALANGQVATNKEDIANLEEYVGTFTHDTAKTVVEYIDAKTNDIATSGDIEGLDTRVTAVEGDVATIKGDYLKASDKTELQGQITTNTNAIERLTNGVSAEEIDSVNDLINYVNEHGTEVTGMKEDISENAAAIEGVAGRMTTAEGKITAVEGAVATKAEKNYVDEQVQALQGEDTNIKGRLDALESAVGESTSIADDIATAKQEAIDAAALDAANKSAVVLAESQSYIDAEIDNVEGTITTLQGVVDTKADQSEVNTISGKVSTLETDMEQVKAEINSFESITSEEITAMFA